MHSRFINTGSARVGEVASLAPPPYARTQVHAPRGSGGRVMSVRACVHVAPVAHRRGERPRGRVRQVRMVAFSLFYGRPLALPRGAPERMHGMWVAPSKHRTRTYELRGLKWHGQKGAAPAPNICTYTHHRSISGKIWEVLHWLRATISRSPAASFFR